MQKIEPEVEKIELPDLDSLVTYILGFNVIITQILVLAFCARDQKKSENDEEYVFDPQSLSRMHDDSQNSIEV